MNERGDVCVLAVDDSGGHKQARVNEHGGARVCGARLYRLKAEELSGFVDLCYRMF